MNYQINITIDQAGVEQIASNAQTITMVKNVTSNPLATGNLQVAWIAFAPFLSNQVTWTADYLVYASQTLLQAGAQIAMVSQLLASPGPLYKFSGGVFSTDGTQGSSSTYNVENDFGSSLTFGLAQQATINGASVLAPLNAVRIGNDQQATFTPIETVSIYLSSFQNNGVVISQVAGTALTVNLTSQQPVANVGFTDKTNSFFLINQTGPQNALTHADVAVGRIPQADTAARRVR